ncbi:glycosyltransferase family 2 protein [Rheinheimera mangrovi]|uniref:glycosyltransferase family 2 protein n=1 Tax=Rheinheimera mangrovi TaxID=2498451 RepID=UPI0013DF1EE2|nr:glycosyltransferase family 2 protein [Rheinheimera mangrovi]
MSDWVTQSGAVHHLQVSGEKGEFYKDSKEYMKRLAGELWLLSQADTLVDHSCLFLRCYGAHTVFQGVDLTNKIMLLDKASLFRTMLKCTSFYQLLAHLVGKELLAYPDHPLATQADIFITKAGLSRFGGLDRFRQQAVVWGNTAVAQANHFWVLDDTAGQGKPGDLCSYIQDKVITEDGFLFLFDLVPAPANTTAYQGVAHQNHWLLPRWLITGRKVAFTAPSHEGSAQAVFVMSNYNKSAHLASSVVSIALQSYAAIKLCVMDDASTDDSIATLKRLTTLFADNHWLELFFSCENKGTYWQRNQAILAHQQEHTIYLVNDSDDMSCAQRAWMQSAWIQSNSPDYCIADIVRINSTSNMLQMDKEVERYGTASFAALSSIHKHYGYFENLKKGADTEFIERIVKFAPNSSSARLRYPVLYQSFINNNLTNDIYRIDERQQVLNQDISARSPYMELFRDRHSRLGKFELPLLFTAGQWHFPESYFEKLPEFLIARQSRKGPVLHVEQILSQQSWLTNSFDTVKGVSATASATGLSLESRLQDKQHAYLMLQQPIHDVLPVNTEESNVLLKVVAQGQLSVSGVLIYYDGEGRQLHHQFYWLNEPMPIEVPANCKRISFGFRVQGSGFVVIKEVIVQRYD